ncbi:asparaginase [Salinicola avicenniae]|uniref:asparaginase n=1 Tax=Salinicola avicenniae TaxID=2916836 RepID=UPI0020746292|nr:MULTISPECIES: asparaginase [unclassified Salinicola]
MSFTTKSSTNSVLVLYAGGTIGMQKSPRGLVPGERFASRLSGAIASLSPSRQARLPDYDLWEAPRPIDSSSATPADWRRLAAVIAERLDEYAGFIVLHGTDTLAWCASSLAFQLQGLNKPVIVTGSQRPLDITGSDALSNVETALAFATHPTVREVCIAFGSRLLRGCRARKWYTQHDTGFESPNWPPLGEMVDDHPVLYAGRCWPADGAPRLELVDPADEVPKVIRLPLWPGIGADDVARQIEPDNVKGVILESWGSGNLPEDDALLGALAKASAEGKVLATLSQCPVGGVQLGTYASGQGLKDIGVLSADDMTPEAAFGKLTHLISLKLPEAEVRRRFLTSLVGERGVFTV